MNCQKHPHTLVHLGLTGFMFLILFYASMSFGRDAEIELSNLQASALLSHAEHQINDYLEDKAQNCIDANEEGELKNNNRIQEVSFDDERRTVSVGPRIIKKLQRCADNNGLTISQVISMFLDEGSDEF